MDFCLSWPSNSSQNKLRPWNLLEPSCKLCSAACKFFPSWGETRVTTYSHFHIKLALPVCAAAAPGSFYTKVILIGWTWIHDDSWWFMDERSKVLQWIHIGFGKFHGHAARSLSPCRAKKILCSKGWQVGKEMANGRSNKWSHHLVHHLECWMNWGHWMPLGLFYFFNLFQPPCCKSEVQGQYNV